MSKKNSCFFKTLFLVVFATLLCACSNSIDSMIDDYNGHFTVDSEEDAYSVDNVIAESMLANQYPVPYRTTLCLSAPTGGTKYSWIAVISENAAGIDEGTSYTLYVGDDRNLILYIPNSVLKQWAHYELTLTVQKPDGGYLQDTAKLYIY